MYIRLLDSSRLEEIVYTLAKLEYDDYEFMEEMIVEVFARTDITTSKERFLVRIFIDNIHDYFEKLDISRIIQEIRHRTDEETAECARDVMNDIIEILGEIDEDDDDDDDVIDPEWVGEEQ